MMLDVIEEQLLSLDIIRLHDIARDIENTVGRGQLSEDIRKAADRLNALLKNEIL